MQWATGNNDIDIEKLLLTKVQTQLVVFSTRTFTSTEMKIKTIGETAHTHRQLSPSHGL